jgi:hypothetical protein
MGVNIFALSPDNSEGVIESIVNMLNSTKSYRKYFDWCDIFKGEGKAVMTLPEALAVEDEAGPFYVYDPLMIRESKLKVTNDGMHPLRSKWQPLLESYPVDDGEGHPIYVIFIKARG